MACVSEFYPFGDGSDILSVSFGSYLGISNFVFDSQIGTRIALFRAEIPRLLLLTFGAKSRIVQY